MAGRPRKWYQVDTKKKGLRKREGPSLNANVLEIIPNGAKICIDPKGEAPPGWALVEGGGYVMLEYLK